MTNDKLEAIRRRDQSPYMASTAWLSQSEEDRRALLAAYDALAAAAQAVVDRWDTPLWKDAEPTAGVINRLRRVLEGER